MDSLPEFELRSAEELKTFMTDQKLLISELTYSAIKRALQEGALYMPVMKIMVHDLPVAVITVKRDNFNESLNKCLKCFEEVEQYEKCADILKILKDDLYLDIDVK
jgi:hypothetical protein